MSSLTCYSNDNSKKYNWENEVKKLENIYINAFNKK